MDQYIKILEVFPFFEEERANSHMTFLVSPAEHFDDPQDSVCVTYLGGVYELQISGPGELHIEHFQTQEEVISALTLWLNHDDE